MLNATVPDQAIDRWNAELAFRAVVEATADKPGLEFMRHLVKNLAKSLGVAYAFVAEFAGAEDRVKTIAFWSRDDWHENVEYRLTGTPCQQVIAGELCLYRDNVQQLFPEDPDLVSLGVRSYLGLPLRGANGQTLGHLAALDTEPMPDDARGLTIFQVFANRARVEMERLHAEAMLQRAFSDLEVRLESTQQHLAVTRQSLDLAYEELRQLCDRLAAENVYLKEEIQQEHNFEEIVGQSRALGKVLELVETVAPTTSSVLILGETGTGKELIARAIHNRSPRRDRPLVKVNCSAISASLVESELFGHVRGAFTGAVGQHIGRFEVADGGTIFLDEVGELPLDTQVKLLRVLQEREIEAVGSSESKRVDVRVIAATSRDLEKEVAAGRFRADLYFRLSVFPIVMPPLRDRDGDIALLAHFFIDRFARGLGKTIESVSRASIDRLSAYDWPGNVRELSNLIERSIVLAKGSILEIDETLLPAQPGSATANHRPAGHVAAVLAESTNAQTLDEVTRLHVLDVLQGTRWVIEGPRGAAAALGLRPSTLRSRMKKLGVTRVDRAGS